MFMYIWITIAFVDQESAAQIELVPQAPEGNGSTLSTQQNIPGRQLRSAKIKSAGEYNLQKHANDGCVYPQCIENAIGLCDVCLKENPMFGAAIYCVNHLLHEKHRSLTDIYQNHVFPSQQDIYAAAINVGDNASADSTFQNKATIVRIQVNGEDKMFYRYSTESIPAHPSTLFVYLEKGRGPIELFR